MGVSTRRPALPALTGLRFLAALHVVLYHASGSLNPSLAGFPLARAFLSMGPNAVGLFFVLSGFILAYTYLGPPEEHKLQARGFWAARFARVYPVYMCGILAAAPLTILGFLRGAATPFWWTATLVQVLTLTQAWTPQFALAWNSPGWSLSAEAFFYLVFPFLAPRFWPLRRAGLFVTLGALWILSQVPPLLHALTPASGWPGWDRLDPAFWTATMDDVPYRRWETPGFAFIQYNPLVRLPEFLFGVALGRLHLLPGMAPQSRAWGYVALGAGGILLTALTLLPLMPHFVPPLFVHNGLLTPVCGLLIYALARPQVGFLGGRTMALLGEASYALYIVHVPLRHLLEGPVRRLADGELLGPGFVFVYVLIAITLSIGILRRIEEPARRWLRGR